MAEGDKKRERDQKQGEEEEEKMVNNVSNFTITRSETPK